MHFRGVLGLLKTNSGSHRPTDLSAHSGFARGRCGHAVGAAGLPAGPFLGYDNKRRGDSATAGYPTTLAHI